MATKGAEDYGGYNLTFTNDEAASQYQCHICSLVAREPQQATCCGKIYCKNCLEASKKKRPKTICPVCSRPLTGKYFKDVRAEHEIMTLQVNCSNTDSGCQWEGTVNDIEAHLDSCPYQLIPCTNECGEDVRRSELGEHLTENCQNCRVKCRYCQKEGLRGLVMSDRHLNKCRDYPLKCSNEECEEVIPRRLLALHNETCPKAIITCEYNTVGCNKIMKREEKEEHNKESVQEHLQMAVKKIEVFDLKNSSNKVFKLTEFIQKKTQKIAWNSPGFYTSPRGYKMRLRIDCSGFGEGRGNYISAYIYLMSGEHDNTLEWPFQGEVTIELLNQLEDKNHVKGTVRYHESTPVRVRQRVPSEVSMHGWGYCKFIPHVALKYNPSPIRQYLKDDSLYFRVSVKVTSKTKPWLAVS